MPEYTDPKDYSAVRRILRSEITWFVGAAVGVVMFYQNVIIPINNMQLALASIQVQIEEVKSTQADLPAIQQDHAVMKQEIGQLQSEMLQHIKQIQ
jgi:hypothetical protein